MYICIRACVEFKGALLASHVSSNQALMLGSKTLTYRPRHGFYVFYFVSCHFVKLFQTSLELVNLFSFLAPFFLFAMGLRLALNLFYSASWAKTDDMVLLHQVCEPPLPHLPL